MTLDLLAAALLIGLIAGVFGGLAGIGGSMVMLPALHMAYGDSPDRPEIHHLFMASAMAVNVVVALPAAIQHGRNGAVRWPLLKRLLPITAITLGAGAASSNFVRGNDLRLALALFLMAYCVWNLTLIMRPRRRAWSGTGRIERANPLTLGITGGVTGSISGMLGLGGGVIMVPLLQVLCNVKLRNAIGTSSAIMCFTALVGSSIKLATLHEHGETLGDAFLLAACMAPTAVLGSMAGARLMHRLPIVGVRFSITVLLLVSAARLAGF